MLTQTYLDIIINNLKQGATATAANITPKTQWDKDERSVKSCLPNNCPTWLWWNLIWRKQFRKGGRQWWGRNIWLRGHIMLHMLKQRWRWSFWCHSVRRRGTQRTFWGVWGWKRKSWHRLGWRSAMTIICQSSFLHCWMHFPILHQRKCLGPCSRRCSRWMPTH